MRGAQVAVAVLATTATVLQQPSYNRRRRRALLRFYSQFIAVILELSDLQKRPAPCKSCAAILPKDFEGYIGLQGFPEGYIGLLQRVVYGNYCVLWG